MKKRIFINNTEDTKKFILLSNPANDPYAMQCPDTMGDYPTNMKYKKSPAFFVRQNIISGKEPIVNEPIKWREAASEGKFNYTACDFCNTINYTGRIISPKPDCNGNCFFIDDPDVIGRQSFNYFGITEYEKEDMECTHRFNCGAINKNGIHTLQDDYGWYFNDFTCPIVNTNGYKYKGVSCSSCSNCSSFSSTTPTIMTILDIVKLINNGVSKLDNCYEFCTYIINSNNEFEYISILDIINVIDCLENDNCSDKNSCGV